MIRAVGILKMLRKGTFFLISFSIGFTGQPFQWKGDNAIPQFLAAGIFVLYIIAHSIGNPGVSFLPGFITLYDMSNLKVFHYKSLENMASPLLLLSILPTKSTWTLEFDYETSR